MLRMRLNQLASVLRQYLLTRVTPAVNLLVKKIGRLSLEEGKIIFVYIIYIMFGKTNLFMPVKKTVAKPTVSKPVPRPQVKVNVPVPVTVSKPVTVPEPQVKVNGDGSVHVLLIEADNARSLGGSCLRDIVNIDYYTNEFSKQNNIKRGQTFVLSIDNDTKIQSKFTTKNIVFDKLNNYKTAFAAFTNNVLPNDYVIILISGHGYQRASKTSEETDRLDEYIAYNGGIILDNEINTLLVSKLGKSKRAVCLGDTCHSGTLFDIDIKSSSNVYSLSACLDNQLDSCDIGYNAGFGGALTVQLLDIENSIKTMLLGNKDDINKMVSKLSLKLQLLNQKPLLCGM
jgi:hypothetical protein